MISAAVSLAVFTVMACALSLMFAWFDMTLQPARPGGVWSGAAGLGAALAYFGIGGPLVRRARENFQRQYGSRLAADNTAADLLDPRYPGPPYPAERLARFLNRERRWLRRLPGDWAVGIWLFVPALPIIPLAILSQAGYAFEQWLPLLPTLLSCGTMAGAISAELCSAQETALYEAKAAEVAVAIGNYPETWFDVPAGDLRDSPAGHSDPDDGMVDGPAQLGL
jgi:hypothetical protein